MVCDHISGISELWEINKRLRMLNAQLPIQPSSKSETLCILFDTQKYKRYPIKFVLITHNHEGFGITLSGIVAKRQGTNLLGHKAWSELQVMV